MNFRLLALLSLAIATYACAQKKITTLNITHVELSSGQKGAATPTIAVRFTFLQTVTDKKGTKNNVFTKEMIARDLDPRSPSKALINLQDPSNQKVAKLVRRALKLKNSVTQLGLSKGSATGTPGNLLWKNYITSVFIPPTASEDMPGASRRFDFCNGPCKLKKEKL